MELVDLNQIGGVSLEQTLDYGVAPMDVNQFTGLPEIKASALSVSAAPALNRKFGL